MDKEPKLDAEALVELGKNLEEMCAEYRFGYCFGCPFRGDGDLFFCDKSSFTNRTAEDWQKVLAAVEKWRNRDRSKRIDPTEIEFIRGRVKFGDSKINAPFPSMIVVFGGDKE